MDLIVQCIGLLLLILLNIEKLEEGVTQLNVRAKKVFSKNKSKDQEKEKDQDKEKDQISVIDKKDNPSNN